MTPLGLITPVNVPLSTLPSVAAGAGAIPILAGASLAPQRTGIEGQSQAIEDVAKSPITQSIQRLSEYMLDKFDPDKRAEREAKKSLLNMQVKQGEMEMALAPQKFELEKQKLSQEVEQNKYTNDLLSGKLGLQRQAQDDEKAFKLEALKNEQKRILLDSSKAKTEKERESILNRGREIQNEMDELNLKQTQSLLSQPESGVDEATSRLRFMSNPILKAQGQEAYDRVKKRNELELEEKKQESKNMVPGYGIAYSEKEAQELRKGIAAQESAKKAIEELKKMYEENGSELFGEKADKMRSLATQAQIDAKTAFELGALSGPDYGLMTAVIPDPTTWSAAFTPKSISDYGKRYEEFIKKMDRDKESGLKTKLKKRFQESEPMNSEENYVQINTQEEYDKLPKGSKYIDSEGKTAIKR